MLLPHNHVTDTYGSKAKALLQPLQRYLTTLTREVTDRFYGYISDQGRTAEIIQRLRPETFRQLKQKQAQYLAMLLSDDLTHAMHINLAQSVGRAHTFEDVEIRWLVEAYSFYQEEIHKLLREHIADSEDREMLLQLIAQRFLQDIEAQASSYKQITAEISKAFSQIDQEVMSTSNLTDLIRAALMIIGTLPGGISVFFARVDDAGLLQIEQSYGDAAEQYHRAMEAGKAPKLNIDPSIPAGRGPGGRSWRSGEIVITDAWLLQADLKPWQKIGEKLGFRSNASVPLLDDSGQSIALLSLYSPWPGYFSTSNIHGFLRHMQQVLSHGVQQRVNARVVPLREQQAYRTLLTKQRVVIYYQPVINLRDGSLVKIEGLARLRHQDGKLIAPQQFLPALGRDELLSLFEQGMRRICEDLRILQQQNIDTKIAINLPAEGLDDSRYEQSFFNCLESCDLIPQHFQLEVLETQDAGDRTALHKAFIQRLQAAGVQIAQDDLGSGHSSLLRLDQYPFDEVKIDQGLVRGALHNPKRAIEFILYLTRLAHAFGTSVTVEGLENMGMIEAAAILGADSGQGYGIARPMPLDHLSQWHQNFNYTVNPRKPKTAIGALAGYLLWDMQLATISERPELATEFVGTKSIVEQFINANGLKSTPLDQLLMRNHELIAAKKSQSKAATIIRSQLIKELTDYWLREANS